jgi:hypothetical protein
MGLGNVIETQDSRHRAKRIHSTMAALFLNLGVMQTSFFYFSRPKYVDLFVAAFHGSLSRHNCFRPSCFPLFTTIVIRVACSSIGKPLPTFQNFAKFCRLRIHDSYKFTCLQGFYRSRKPGVTSRKDKKSYH